MLTLLSLRGFVLGCGPLAILVGLTLSVTASTESLVAQAFDDKGSLIVSDEARLKAATEAMKKLQQDYGDALDEYYRPYREAKTEEERAAIELDPTQDPALSFTGRFLQLADEHPGTPAAIEALNMVISLSRRGPGDGSSPAQKKAVETILDKYIDHPTLTDLVRFAHYQGATETNIHFLETLMESSSHRPTVASATYSLGKILGETPETSTRARTLLERVKSEYGDVIFWRDTTYGQKVDGDIFELENLAIGKVAPEIVGVDLDGKEMKLSQFLGQVVLIDFWGDW